MSDEPIFRRVKAAKGRQVRRSDSGQPLEAAGEDVIWSSYWQRRLDDDDVTELPPETETPATKGR